MAHIWICHGKSYIGHVIWVPPLTSGRAIVRGVGQERSGLSHFSIPLVLVPPNSLVWYVPSLRYTRGLDWRMHCGAENQVPIKNIISLSADP